MCICILQVKKVMPSYTQLSSCPVYWRISYVEVTLNQFEHQLQILIILYVILFMFKDTSWRSAVLSIDRIKKKYFPGISYHSRKQNSAGQELWFSNAF